MRHLSAMEGGYQLSARQDGVSRDTVDEVGIGIGGLYLFARDDVEEFGCDGG